MAHINAGVHQPGIKEWLFSEDSFAEALSHLAYTLIYPLSPLFKGKWNSIAAIDSNLNNCEFYHDSLNTIKHLHVIIKH